MKKFTKQLLTGLVALGLLAPVATNVSNQPVVNVQAKSRWHRGEPKALKHYRSYITNFQRTKPYGFTKTVADFENYGTEPYYILYTKHYHYKNTGCGWGDFWHPYYRYLGHHTWEIHEGNHGENHYTVKLHGYHHISLWSDGEYLGYFHGLHYMPTK